jgi:DNA-binding MarR family transcriptional regulator
MPGSIPEPRDDPAGEVADLLQEISHRIRREARRDLDPADVTWSQVRALRAVARLGERPRMSELADALHVARRSATSLVDELEQRRLVRRHRDPTDRRAVTLEITDRGRALLRELQVRRQDAARRTLAPLDAAELATLRRLLVRLD